MEGIVQMLHRLCGPSDKYLHHAHRTRISHTQSRSQAHGHAQPEAQVPGPCATVLALPHHKDSHCLLTGHIWLILHILLVYKFRLELHISLTTVLASQ